MSVERTRSDGSFVDKWFGFVPLSKKPDQPVKEHPPFPGRALRDAPGEPPLIEADT